MLTQLVILSCGIPSGVPLGHYDMGDIGAKTVGEGPMYRKLLAIGHAIMDEARAVNDALAPFDVLVTASCFLALICELDWLTTYELSVNPFYLLVVIFVTWRCGWKWGLAFALTALANQIAIGLVIGNPFSSSVYFVAACLERLFSSVVIIAVLIRLRTAFGARDYFSVSVHTPLQSGDGGFLLNSATRSR